jgi:hypothetical protein
VHRCNEGSGDFDRYKVQGDRLVDLRIVHTIDPSLRQFPGCGEEPATAEADGVRVYILTLGAKCAPKMGHPLICDGLSEGGQKQRRMREVPSRLCLASRQWPQCGPHKVSGPSRLCPGSRPWRSSPCGPGPSGRADR